MARTSYFIDRGITGSREFVRSLWEELKSEEDNPDTPPRVAELDGLYSLKRLSENII